ncbi:MAG: LysR family transcriptional regulator [Negativicutes bacterium]|nr:LysR family transcriptional regulator [Negativicutes bacterium]
MYLLGIEAFLAVVRTQSLTRAADELHLAQSSVSHRLKILEEDIGSRLIERSKGVQGIRLTPTGEDFVQIAERWTSLWRDTQILKSQGSNLTLSVGTVDSLNTFYFPSLYLAICQHQPPLRLAIRAQHSVELYEEIDRRHIDLAFVLREMAVPNVMVMPCFAEPMVILSLATPANSGAETLHPTELDSNHELYIPWGPVFQAWHDEWWDPLCPSRIRLDSASLLFCLLRDPCQWALVPMWVANVALKRGVYAIRKLSPAPPDLMCYRITHKYPKANTIRSIAVFDHYFALLQQNQLDSNILGGYLSLGDSCAGGTDNKKIV